MIGDSSHLRSPALDLRIALAEPNCIGIVTSKGTRGRANLTSPAEASPDPDASLRYLAGDEAC